ncbi:MAG TPA: SDR family oxidoreductase [Candidatus Nanoarchaeia archaeon]|nr:SDR family oxidoreductase [Candidatus Nanoarchaeia archaeon]
MTIGKVALITGSSRGIGLEIAKTLYRNNYSVSLISRNKDELQRSFGKSKNALFIKCDVSSVDDIKSAVAQTIKRFGRIDILVNNAGVNLRTDFMHTTKEEWNEVINTNLTSVFFISQFVGNIMLKQKGGSIINISSVLGIKADSVSVQYGVSKGAIITLTKYLAKTFAPNISVNCIAPGFVNTGWHSDKSPERIQSIIERIPMKRFAEPKEVAQLAFFLASQGRYITGETIIMDGGYSL